MKGRQAMLMISNATRSMPMLFTPVQRRNGLCLLKGTLLALPILPNAKHERKELRVGRIDTKRKAVARSNSAIVANRIEGGRRDGRAFGVAGRGGCRSTSAGTCRSEGEATRRALPSSTTTPRHAAHATEGTATASAKMEAPSAAATTAHATAHATSHATAEHLHEDFRIDAASLTKGVATAAKHLRGVN